MFTDGSAVGSFQTVNFTTIFEDAIPEIDETFVGVLQPSNTALGDTDNFALGSQSTITVTIVDDDVGGLYLLIIIIIMFITKTPIYMTCI